MQLGAKMKKKTPTHTHTHTHTHTNTHIDDSLGFKLMRSHHYPPSDIFCQ
jgi:hypothetical protein